MGMDAYADPLSLFSQMDAYSEITIARFVGDGIDQRARVLDVLDDLEKNSLDFYAQLKSLSQQHRASELRRGVAAAPESDFYQDPGTVEPAVAKDTPRLAKP
jgi:phospholipid-binding lipoprotein MlaA